MLLIFEKSVKRKGKTPTEGRKVSGETNEEKIRRKYERREQEEGACKNK